MNKTEDSIYPRNVGELPSDDVYRDDVYRHVTLEQMVDAGIGFASIDRDLKLIIKDLKLIIKLLKEKK